VLLKTAVMCAPLEAVTEFQIDEQLAVNVKGLFFTIQKAVPLMEKGASIVVTTSSLNAVGTPGLSILSATKAAVRSLARTLGAELAPRGIRINAVSPGPISTSFAAKMGLSAALFLASSDSSLVSRWRDVADLGVGRTNLPI
jgi:NAD(P)-dependent dehydrogenase (short-subunit alcohol dehydrogenase family)